MCNCTVTASVMIHRLAHEDAPGELKPAAEAEVAGYWDDQLGLVFPRLWCGTYSFTSGAHRALVLQCRFCPECGQPRQ